MTEQFAVGTLLYYMVYGHEPYEDTQFSSEEVEHRFEIRDFPKLESRERNFDRIISACWHHVYPTMALLAFDCERSTEGIARVVDNTSVIIDSAEETRHCEELIRQGLLGPDLASQ